MDVVDLALSIGGIAAAIVSVYAVIRIFGAMGYKAGKSEAQATGLSTEYTALKAQLTIVLKELLDVKLMLVKQEAQNVALLKSVDSNSKEIKDLDKRLTECQIGNGPGSGRKA